MNDFFQQLISTPTPWERSGYETFDIQSPRFFRSTENEVEEEVKRVNDYSFVERADKTGRGFLSVQIKTTALAGLIHQGLNFYQQKILNTPLKTIVVDYGGMNMAKQLHVGHIRSLFIGDSLCKIYTAQGHTVVRQNHVGDIGAQFGYLIEYIDQEKLAVSDNKQLTEIYKLSKNLFETDSDFASRANERAKLLQSKDPNTMLIWNQMREVSDQNMHDFFEYFHLDLSLNDTKGESFYLESVSETVEDLVQKGLAEKDPDGSVFVNGKNPMVLRKSTGAYLYGAIDVAALRYRQQTYQPDEIVYVVDKRQKAHFEQVFDLAQQAGFSTTKTTHLGFGTILGIDKKPLKTRSGDALYLDELMEMGFEQYRQSEQGQKNLQEPNHLDIEQKTVIGALKYYDLHLNPKEDYVFDWSFVLNTKGQSAPYLQNAIVRVDSLFAQNDNRFLSILNNPPQNHIEFLDQLKKYDFSTLTVVNEAHGLVMDLMQSVEDIVLADHSTRIVQSMLVLAKRMHGFYESLKILGHPQEKDIMDILEMVGTTLVYGTSLLGVEAFPSIKNRLNDTQDLLGAKKPTRGGK